MNNKRLYGLRTEFINQAIASSTNADEKRLLSNGFIPDSLLDSYNKFMQSDAEPVNEGTELDIISNSNYFGINPEKVSGIIKPGSGFLNPILVKGTIEDAVKTINLTLNSNIKTENEPVKKVEFMEPKLKPYIAMYKGKKHELYAESKYKAQLAAAEFFKAKHSYDVDVYVAEEDEPKQEPINEESEPINEKKPIIHEPNFEPKIDTQGNALAIIKSQGLIDDEPTRKVKYTTQETIEKYNPGITTDEIIAWVWYKRQFGNPMKGWEKYFMDGDSGFSLLVKTTKDTVIKDNKYADIRTVPANTILGKKTKFKNTYGTDTLIIVRTDTNQLIWVNSDHVEEIKHSSGQNQAELDRLVIAGALIFDGDDYFPIPVFLFGDIYDKINTLKANQESIVSKYGIEIHENQITLANSYRPMGRTFRDPVRSKRPFINSLSEFATDFQQFGVTTLNEETNIRLGQHKGRRFYEITEKISLFDAFTQWVEATVRDTDLTNTTKSNIKTYYWNRAVRWPKDELGHDIYTSAQKDELIGSARIAGEELFSDFLSTALTYEDSVALDVIWNEKYNSFTNVGQFLNKIPIGFDGSAMFKEGELSIKAAQRHGLAFLQLVGSGCIAYDVGFGKTACAILNLAQLLSQGKIKRPLVVVPKPTYKNWVKEIFGYWTDGEKTDFEQFEGAKYHYGILSGTKVNFVDWYNLSGNHYKQLLAKNDGDINKLVPENSITVVSYKGFEQMGFSKNISQDMFDSISKVVMQKETTEGDPKAAAKQYEKIVEWLGYGNKNAIIDVDVCGFDHITVDEAHNFKNVFPSCGKDESTGRKLFNLQASQSSRAVKMFFITQWIQRKYGRNVVTLTATPFTNSPLEIYSMLSFVGLDTLKEYNLYNIKKFFEQFVLETIEYAIDAKGEIVTKPVIKSFNNLRLLQTILYNHFDYKDNPKEANVVRPCKIDLPNRDITTYLTMNEWQIKNQQQVKSIAKSVSRQNQGAVLKAINYSLDNAFSPFLFNNDEPESAEAFIENSPKIKYAVECIRTVKAYHESRGEECSGILIYTNRGKQYFEYIKQYLIQYVGFKSRVSYDDELIDEIEIITGGGSEAEQDHKELVKDAFNAGIVKVILGTSTICEGVNLQARGTLIIDLYPEWNPTDIRQLQGRMWRQGNRFGYVRFVMPLVVNSMDNFINQKQDEKSKRISSLWHSVGELNVEELTSDLDPSEIKYELVDDPEEKFKIKFDTLKQSLERDLKIAQENKQMLDEIGGNVTTLTEARDSVYGDLKSKVENWREYLQIDKKQALPLAKKAKNKKLTQAIELSIKNISELLEDWIKMESNPNDIVHLLKICRDLSSRRYVVDNDYTDEGREVDSLLYKFRWNTFEVSSWDLNALKSAYASVRKAEKSVLAAYKKAWYDDISDIKTDVEKKIEEITAYAEKVKSEEYKNTIMLEIQADLEAKKALRGDIETQVAKFASLNHTLSYLSDNTDKENCPIPTDECCSTNFIDIIDSEKKGDTFTERVQEPATDQEIKTGKVEALKTRLELLNEMVADETDSNKKENLKTRIELIEEMISDFSGEPEPAKEVKTPKAKPAQKTNKPYEIPSELNYFIPKLELKTLKSNIKGEEREFFIKMLDELNQRVKDMPGPYKTDDIETDDKIVQLHYFSGSSDWYIVERDSSKEQLQAFGYVILNGDTQNAEWGYVPIAELLDIPQVELDLYFKPKTFKELNLE